MTVSSTPAIAHAPTPASTVTPTAHPTPCPSWCRDRRHPAGHHFGPTVTWHWGQQVRLANPAPLDNDVPVILRAELFRSDEDGGTGEASMYLGGETDMEMGADEVDLFIVQAQAFVDALRVMRQQMGPSA